MATETPEGPSVEDATGFPPELLAPSGSPLNPLMATTDWARTPLGPVRTWCPELRTAVGICLNSPFPMLLMWGPELAMVYNDAFVPILGAKHPALGRPCPEVWADAWPVVGDWIRGVMDRGEATHREDLPLVVQRHGFDEAVHFTFAYSPVPLAAGGVGGVFTVVTETTGQVLGARRLGALRELGEARSAQVADVRQACAAAVDVLGRHRADVPFGVVYLLDGDGDGDADADADGGRARAVASYGLAAPDAATGSATEDPLPLTVSERAGEDWIRQALTTGRPRVREDLAPLLAGRLLPGADPAGDAPAHTAVALPLPAAGGDRSRGVLVLGVSPYLPLDDSLRGFLNLAADHLGAAVADAEAQAAQLLRTERLAELDRAKTRFFTSVSHELRTPLTLIAGPAQDSLADRQHPLPAAQRRRVEIIERNAGRLRRLVDTLLDFSRIQDGRLEPEFAAVDLGALTRGIAQSFAPAMQRAGLRFTVDCPAETGAVRADPELWERIVLNLLSNALKFTREGEVRLSLVPTDETVELRVEDTGIGIAEDELPHVFERFRQARTDGARSHEGSGIGLALVRELAALHDGEARATSRPGRGTTLTVRIPAVRPPAAQPRAAVRSAAGDYVAEALQWSAPPTPARSAAAPPPAAGAGTVLVAEDNADLRAYLTSLLEPFYAVELASDGDEALELARSLRPDLVLADVMMPGRDGFDLLRALRAEPATARTPVVFLSARAGEEAAVEGLAAGADDYLAKPFSSTDLLARIRSNLDLARLRNHESAWRTALVNAMQDGFFVANSELAVIEVNDAFTQLLGYPAAQLPWPVPHPWWPTAEQDPEGFALVRDALAAVRATGAARVVLPLNHRDGRRLWMDVALDSLHDRDGDRKLLIGTLRDVTTQHLAAERDAAVARLADLLAGIDDGPRVLRVALAELRDCWQARRVSLLRWDEADEPDTTATTGPVPPAGPELPPVRAARHARTGRLFTEPDDDTAPGRADSRPVSAVGAPLFDGAEQGMLWFEFDRPRPFTVVDRTLLLQLTGHLQRALSRARAADEQRTVALALQRAILGPTDLPAPFAVRYEPASSTLEVGGDWYDVLELPDGRYGVVVGDVVGSGLPAAATMGQLRSAARALLLENNGPARTLGALDRFGQILPGAFCSTVFCAVIDPAAGTVTYSSAGHLPALLAAPDGTTRRLDGAQAVPLAVLPGHARPEATADLPGGCALLLYTDGLVERRSEIIDLGIARAATALAESRCLAPAAAVEHLCASLLGGGHHEDDVALLVYRQP
ncbi:histidine kinase [Streptomyces subrutilus]|uniref:histidine kinase n=1 Tax=Streptomyces subrutilus TaxID=36818 RepID=A0A5P2UVB6_9ACTN|nr:SpoIIE family protein phosphatase [Streptomyces subrutilus]QEU82165.1 response regulator [Streptomyces subrutilus]GGZ92476.1 histidine kinase [Streptomyces subrutilus]